MARRNIDRQALRQQIQELDIDNELKSQLLDAVSEQKKYGLVWENHKEDAEELLREKIPVLKEEAPLRLSPGGEGAPNHILIEGDNLHALTALTYTHEGMVDVIYIDPPYNLGKDFIYNDKCIDSNDGYKHSKWLSAQYRRLVIAKKLLALTGVIFISINNKECSQLKLLCDEIFDEENFIGHLTWESTTQPVNTGKGKYRLQQKVESILCYAKSKANKPNFILEELESNCKYPHDGIWGKCRFEGIEKSDAGSYNRGTMKFPILGQYPRKGKRWQIGEKTARELERNKKVEIVDGMVKVAIYPEDEEDKRKFAPFWSHFTAAEVGSALNGKDQLNNIMGGNVGFDTVKPIKLITQLLSHFHRNCTILDFYAGSGTTLNAVMKMNSKDNGARNCILVQSPESFCTEVDGELIPKEGFEYLYSLGCRTIVDLTYARNRRIINGYENSDNIEVEGLKDNNLRYYKVDFVERENTSANRKRLMQLSTDLLCIKENIYNEEPFIIDGKKMKKDFVRYFKEGDRQMMIIYDPRAISFVTKALPLGGDGGGLLRVYVYSDGQYAYNDEFRGLNVELCALPDAIYQALNRVLPPPLLSPLGDDEIPSGDIIMTDNETIKNTSPRGGQEGTL